VSRVNAKKRQAEPLAEFVLLFVARALLFFPMGRTVKLDGEERVVSRPVALRRAISNLVDNEIKYGGGVEVGLAVQ
jgi:hypothetical protein